MKLSELVTEFASVRAPGWLVLDEPELLQCAIEACRYYVAYGDIASLSGSDPLPGASGSATPIVYDPPELPSSYAVDSDSFYSIPTPVTPPVYTDPIVRPALPIKDLGLITPDVELRPGEWAVIRPLFVLYAERDSAQRLESTRSLGLEVHGRSTSEITGDIRAMEDDTLPGRAFDPGAITII